MPTAMKKRELGRAVERHFTPLFRDLRIDGDLLVARTGPVLYGFAFERSQMDKHSFRVHAFAQVLSVPFDAVAFAIGRTLGDFSASAGLDEAVSDAAREAAGPGRRFISQAASVEQLVESLPALADPNADRRLLRESRAHLLVHLGRLDEAVAELRRAEDELDTPEVPYEAEALRRVRDLQDAIEAGTAPRLLETWTQMTTQALELSP
jgi:hypothetical protein